MNNLVCWNCGKSISDVPIPISRHSQCSHCFNELHCCRLCKHYDPERSTYCFEERADTPVQKENANFCDYFTPKPNVFTQGNAQKSLNSKAQLESLFGKTDAEEEPEIDEFPESKEDSTKQALDDLFK